MIKNGKFYFEGSYIEEYVELPNVGQSWKHGQNEITKTELVSVVSHDQYDRGIYDITIKDGDDGRETVERIAVPHKEKCYIIEENYVGPNQDQHIDDDVIKISTDPARKNMSKEICLDGWCGTTDDWAVYARGEYESVEAAREHIKETYKDAREIDDFYDEGGLIKAVYKPGKYEPLCKEATGNFIYDSLKESVNASTTDAEISALVDDWEAAAHEEGYTLTGAYDMAVAYRDVLQE
nr:hypothetical protein [uncultured Sphaerochaeta sp.]